MSISLDCYALQNRTRHSRSRINLIHARRLCFGETTLSTKPLGIDFPGEYRPSDLSNGTENRQTIQGRNLRRPKPELLDVFVQTYGELVSLETSPESPANIVKIAKLTSSPKIICTRNVLVAHVCIG